METGGEDFVIGNDDETVMLVEGREMIDSNETFEDPDSLIAAELPITPISPCLEDSRFWLEASFSEITAETHMERERAFSFEKSLWKAPETSDPILSLDSFEGTISNVLGTFATDAWWF